MSGVFIISRIRFYTYVISTLVVMSLFELFVAPGYVAKSCMKVFLLFVIPNVLNYFYDFIDYKSMFRFVPRQLPIFIAAGVAVFSLIFGGYQLLGHCFDLEQIPVRLMAIGVHSHNFIYVWMYIAFVNSFIEEFFFRGVCFLNIKGGSCLSALLFALYHISIMDDWLSPELFFASLGALFCAAFLFNVLDKWSDNIYFSYVVHFAANFALNAVTFLYLL